MLGALLRKKYLQFHKTACIKRCKTFPKCYIGVNGKQNQQNFHTSVSIAQSTNKSREQRLYVHTNQS